jgi:hypothetical protein
LAAHFRGPTCGEYDSFVILPSLDMPGTPAKALAG